MNSAKELGCNLMVKALEENQKKEIEKKEKEDEIESLESEVQALKKELSNKDKEIAKLKDQESTMERLADKIDEKVKATIDGLKPLDSGNDKSGEDKQAKLIRIAGKAINAVLADRNKQ